MGRGATAFRDTDNEHTIPGIVAWRETREFVPTDSQTTQDEAMELCGESVWLSIWTSLNTGSYSLGLTVVEPRLSGEAAFFEVSIETHYLTPQQTVQALVEALTMSKGPTGDPLLDCDGAQAVETVLAQQASTGFYSGKVRDHGFHIYAQIIEENGLRP